MSKQYDAVSKKIDLVEYIYYLQYQMEINDITVETADASFMVWESSTFKVNGEECTTNEFYEMLSSKWHEVTCNGIIFEYVNDKFMSVEPINIKEERIDNVLRL